ncbi:NADP-dependent oxidoreductase [Chondromyces apiculatus]|uniref:Putative oxidoreductase n=1 Tax=Chondromyces apiculatus DSM 436 TaxID=1192034 RepID=A0A017SWQ7_9BACT|nr:NADP-dependent oxidoreductase [Chondromyces apiculatus]EYF01020.1 putative oxidoreductase [Chondromyces apiculatus DSM 436]
MSDVNRVYRLVTRPQGMVKDSDFALKEEPKPELQGDGQILVRNLYLSVDPTQRGWLERDTYMPMIGLGEVMRAFGAGRVVASRDPGFAPGDLVSGMVGWQDHVVLPAKGPAAPSKLPPGVPVENALSLFGITGLTAYFGLLDIGRPQEGDTVLVSGAAGATGMAVGQIAKIKGCRVIGIAGGKEKTSWLTGELGFDAAIDYKAEDVSARIKELAPRGVNVFFENVGGAILEAGLDHLAQRARVVLCGAISGYNDSFSMQGPRNYMNLVLTRSRMEGFIIIDYFDRVGEAMKDLGTWLQAGKIKDRIDIAEGLDQAPAALRRLFEGKNIGKQLVKIADA